MAWNTLYFELPVFQAQFGGAGASPFKKLYVSMALYANVTNRNEVVRHAVDVSASNRSTGAEGGAGVPTEADCLKMIDFDLVHLILHPEMITSIDHVSYAISRAVTNVLNRKVHSGSFTTEVAYMMGGSSSVAKCMEELCVQTSRTDNKCKAMLTVSISTIKSFGDLDMLVQGIQLPIEKLADMTNHERIAKAFKCSKEELQLPGGLDACVIGRIGTKRI